MNAHILLVEDNSMLRDMLATTLHKAGYHVTATGDGNHARQILTASATTSAPYTYDLVLADILLDTVSGVDIMHHAMQLVYPPIVILLTGYAATESVVAALRAGAYDYLKKPIDADYLLQRIADALHDRDSGNFLPHHAPKPPSPAPQNAHTPTPKLLIATADFVPEPSHTYPYLMCGDVVVNVPHKMVLVGEQQVTLTPIEFALLVCLLERAGMVVLYETLVVCVFGDTPPPQEARQLINAPMYTLRRKMLPHYIIPIQGKGYKIQKPHEVYP